MKTKQAYFIVSLSLLFVIIIGCNSTKISTSSNAPISKEAKLRWKEFKKQGWTCDPHLGTGSYQFQKIIQYTLAQDELGEQKNIVETQNGSGPNDEASFSKARQNARREVASNMGSYYDELISGGTHFSNIYGEDITDELWESTSAFDEVFGSALSKNQLISRFYKNTRGQVKTSVTIVLNIKEFNSTVANMKKEEIREKIEEVRERKESLLKKK